MRTTLDLPDPILRSLKIQAAQSGKSLKTLLNELIVRAMAMPVAPAAEATLPVLRRLSGAKFAPAPAASSANLGDAQLQDDLEKLLRSGFIQ
jgi:hypothetical protein